MSRRRIPPTRRPALAVMRARFAAGDRAGRAACVRAAQRRARASSGCSRASRRSRCTPGSRVARRSTRRSRRSSWSSTARRSTERADLLATRADLLMATGDRGAPAAYAEAAAAAGPEGMALRIRQAWAQLAGGDANSAQATLAPLAPGSERERVAHLLAQAAAAWFSGDAAGAGRLAAEAQVAGCRDRARRARRAWRCRSRRWSPTARATGRPRSRNSLEESLLAPDLADTVFDGHLCVGEFALTSGEPLESIRDVVEQLHANAVRSGARRAQVFARDAARRDRARHRPSRRGRHTAPRGRAGEPRDRRRVGRGARRPAARRDRPCPRGARRGRRSSSPTRSSSRAGRR